MRNRIKMIKILFIGIVALWSNNLVYGQEFRKLDNYLNEVYKSHVIPGFSVAVVNKDGPMYQKGFGKEQLGLSTPFTEKTVSAIGSLTKSMTAMGVMQLVEKGELELDAPVVRYLPQFGTANRDMSDKITVRMLINNTSGLQASPQPSFDVSDKALNKVMADLSSTFIIQEPGTVYEYSNLGFSVAGYLISRVSGMSYKEYLDKKIFGPLEMKNTSTNPENFEQMGALEGHYHGITRGYPAIREKLFESGEFIPAGSFTCSTVRDIGNYLTALLNQGRYGNIRVLSKEGIDKMFEPNTSFPGLSNEQGGDGRPIHYGLGWMISEIEGRKIVHHGGSTGKMSSMTMIDVNNNIAVTLLANIDLTFIDQYQYPTIFNLVNNVLHIAAGGPTTDFGKPIVPDPSVNDFNLGAENKKKYTGEFVQINGGDFWVNFGLSLKIENHRKRLEATMLRGGNVINHFELDFVTPSLAIGRNIGIPKNIRFKLTPEGKVQGLFCSGIEFVRIDEKTKSQYRGASVREFSFLVPNHWKLIEKPQGFVAHDPHNPKTQLIGIFNNPNESEKTESSTKYDTPSLLHSERIGLHVWEHQSAMTKEKDEMWVRTIFQSKMDKLPISFEITSMNEDHTLILQRVIRPLLESIKASTF